MCSSNTQQSLPGLPGTPANIMMLSKERRHQILMQAFKRAIEQDIPLHHREEEFHQYHDTDKTMDGLRTELCLVQPAGLWEHTSTFILM